MKHNIRTQHPLLQLFLVFLFALPLTGCPNTGTKTNPPTCEGEIGPSVGDPHDRLCQAACECNNQRYTGECLTPQGKNEKRCKSLPRAECPAKGKKQSCKLNVEQSGCREGQEICQDQGLSELRWGDCKPIERKDKEQGAADCIDGIDNDCDGKIDNADDGCECKPGEKRLCYTGPATARGVGICKLGDQICQTDHTWGPCQGDVHPESNEKDDCNGLDDNCNGKIDEGLTKCKERIPCETVGERRPCYPGANGCSLKSDGTYACIGACKTGFQECTTEKVFSDCRDYQGPNPEQCDGLDNDCNGQVDENFTDLGKPCSAGQGVCQKQGSFVCKNDKSTTVCSVTPDTTKQTDEICDGLDNDCDGKIDGSQLTRRCFSGTAKGCKRNETTGLYDCIGACRSGSQFCKDGQWTACDGAIEPSEEICNNKDDNCDGQVDEGEICGCTPQTTSSCYPSNTAGCALNSSTQQWECLGVCLVGTKTCLSSRQWGQCTLSVTPTPEVCDGADNDCDGQVDNVPQQTTPLSRACYTGTPTATQLVPPCKAGVQVCTNGAWSACAGQITPSTEVCNGQDDDCDGLPDNLPGTSKQITRICTGSPCGSGSQTCNQGVWGACEAPPQHCFTGNFGCTRKSDGSYTCIYPCQSGLQTCNGTQWSSCVGQALPAEEICNGKDDDCNGLIDDNPKPEQPCDNQAGVCQGSKKTICQNGLWLPCTNADYAKHHTAYETKETKCDNLDNDCDGQNDSLQGSPLPLTRSCQSTCGSNAVQQCKQGVWSDCIQECYSASNGCTKQADGTYQCNGACRIGTQSCSGSSWGTCQNETTPQTEVCNLKDDNCNGQIDEGLDHCVLYFSGSMPANKSISDGAPDKSTFSETAAITADLHGNLYMVASASSFYYGSSTSGSIVRKIDRDANVTTLAGSATAGSTNGSAMQATFPPIEEIMGIAVDQKANVYIAQKSCVRQLTPQGTVSTLSGHCGETGYLDGTKNTSRFAEIRGIATSGQDTVYVLDYKQGTSGPPPTYALITPTISSIRRIEPSGDTTTLHLYESGPFQPRSFFVDANANFYSFARDGYHGVPNPGFGPTLVVVSSGGQTSLISLTDQNIHMAENSLLVSRSGEAFLLTKAMPGPSADRTVSIQKINLNGNLTLIAGASLPTTPPTTLPPPKPNLPGLQFHLRYDSRLPSSNSVSQQDIQASNSSHAAALDHQGNLYVLDHEYGYLPNGSQPPVQYIYLVLRKIVLQMNTCTAQQEGQSRSCFLSTQNRQNQKPCQAGSQTCRNGLWSACVGQILPGIESCSGQDSDCDGQTNNPAQWKGLESCNGRDDDCNGQIDDQVVVDAPYCTNQLTICRNSRATQCTNAAWLPCSDQDYKAHNPDYSPTEICDNVDNNCNGYNNEGLTQCVATLPSNNLPSSQRILGAYGFAWDQQNNLLVNDDNSLKKVTPQGQVSLVKQFASQNARGLVSDSNHNLYWLRSYSSNAYLEKMDPLGQITVLVGGAAGFQDGPAAQARFSNPQGIAIDTHGNLYISDGFRIRKYDTSGNVSTLAGDGTQGTLDGTGTQAKFKGPSDLVFSNGDLYLLDLGNAIRKITLAGVVTTYATLSYRAYPSARALAADSQGGFYVADSSAGLIFYLNASKQWTHVVGASPRASQPTDGPLLQATLPTEIRSLTVTPQGNLYVGGGGLRLVTF